MLSVLALPHAAGAQAVRAGEEFQVNTYTIGNQGFFADDHSIAIGANGGFVVTWTSEYQDGQGYGVFGQSFSSGGAPLGAEFQVNTYTTSYESSPSVAALAGGDFVIVWQAFNQDVSDDGYGVFGRRFSSTGTPLSDEFPVNSYVTLSQHAPSVAPTSDGGFVVVWESAFQDGGNYGVFGQLFSSAGEPVAGEFAVPSALELNQDRPAVGVAMNGSFLVAWENTQGSEYGISARSFTSSGAAVGSEFQVNVLTGLDRREVAVAGLANDFVVAWSGADGDGQGILARRVSSAGTPIGSELLVNSFTSNFQIHPAVAGGSRGFVIAWSSHSQDSNYSYGVFARRFSSDAAPLATEFQVNSFTDTGQARPAIASGSGGFVVAWVSENQDGEFNGIFGQRFAVPIVYDIDDDGTANPLTDGILVLRYLFGFRGAVLIDDAVGDDCNRCTAPEIEAYLDTLD